MRTEVTDMKAYDVRCKKNGEEFDAGYGEYILTDGNPVEEGIDNIVYHARKDNDTLYTSVYYLCDGKLIEDVNDYWKADAVQINEDLYSDFTAEPCDIEGMD